MPLQVRFQHAVGSRVFDVPDRPVSNPLLIGRKEGVDLQVPSTLVSPIHCMIYTHDGQWVIADAGSSAGTYVNGQRLGEPSYLNFGDIIALGQGPTAPTIEVDPLGVARYAASHAPAGPVSRPAPPLTAPGNAPPQPVAPAAAEEDWAQQDWASAAPIRHHHRRPTRSTPAGVFILGGLSIALLVGVVVYFLVRAGNTGQTESVTIVQSNPKPSPPQVARPAPEATRPVRTVRPPVTPDAGKPKVPTEVVTTTNDNPPPATAEAPPDTRAKDPAFLAIEEVDQLTATSDPAGALFRYADYQRQHPDSPFAREVGQFIDRAVDALWWKRIEDLCAARDRHQSNISDISAEIAGATDPKFKERKQDDRQREQELKQYNDQQLAEMGYTSKDPPPMLDFAKMDALRAERKKDLYKKFRDAALRNAQLHWRPHFAPAR